MVASFCLSLHNLMRPRGPIWRGEEEGTEVKALTVEGEDIATSYVFPICHIKNLGNT